MAITRDSIGGKWQRIPSSDAEAPDFDNALIFITSSWDQGTLETLYQHPQTKELYCRRSWSGGMVWFKFEIVVHANTSGDRS